jgi:hypothetical protein
MRSREAFNLSEIAEYTKHLYAEDLEGYLQLAHIPNGVKGGFESVYITGTAVPKSLREIEGEPDYFITPNSYYIPQRASRNIRHFRSLFIDLDLTAYSKTEAIYEVALLSGQGAIPEPTMIIDSGRGLHLYWRIRHAPMQAAWTWQELQDYLCRQLRYLGADFSATDSARLLRIPGTINSRNSTLCKPVVITDKQYSMRDLRAQYLNRGFKTNITEDKPQRTAISGVTYLYTPYSLHKTRLSDLLTICQIRNFDVKGHRNNILHLYAYWQGITRRDTRELAEDVNILNERFREPLRSREVKAIVRCIPKAIEAFLNPEAGPTVGYNYKNETLIEMLDITENEQKHLGTIIDTKEKYRRNNERRRKARRNEAGLTFRQQQKLDTITAIKELRVQGLTIGQIAEEMGLTIKGVEYHLYGK